MARSAELIPGTALPMYAPGDEPQIEGRGEVDYTTRGVSLLEKIGSRDDVAPHELAIVAAALRAFDRAPKKEKTIFQQVMGQTAATTGDLILELFEVPAGMEGHLTFANLDAPGSAITPSAPLAAGTAWAFLAILPPSSLPNQVVAGAALAGRRGLVDFAPNPALATSSCVPSNWTFNDSNAPVGFGGEAFYMVIVGGNVAGIVSKQIEVSFRVNLYSVQ